MGPTASGKTALAEAIAEELGAQLLNADAFQIYRGLDIGTAKPVQRERYRLLDLISPLEEFGVGAFVELAAKELAGLWSQGRSAILVGGTGLYIRALMEGYGEMRPPPDPQIRADLMRIEAESGLEELANRLRAIDPEAAHCVDLKNPVRVRRALERALDPSPPVRVVLPPFEHRKIAVNVIAEQLNARIDSRIDSMMQNGWVDEVRRLMGEGVPREAPGLRAIGYRALYDFVSGVMSHAAAIEGIRIETRQYAKRQRTWLRSEPNLAWLASGQTTEHALKDAMRILASR